MYKIPSTGVLFTQFRDEQGFVNQEYYYVTKEGQRKRLGVLDIRDFNEEWTLEKNPNEPPRDSLAVFNPGTMGTFGSSDNSDKMVYLYLSVGTYNDTLRKTDFSYEYIDSLRKEYRKNKN